MSMVVSLAAVAVLAAALNVPTAEARENPAIEIPSPPMNYPIAFSLLSWTSFEEFHLDAPLAFNTPVYEAIISANHSSLDILSGTVTGWSDPENNGLYTGSWSFQSIGYAWDGWTLRTTRWIHIINPTVSAADFTGIFIARQFHADSGRLHTTIELGVGGASGYSQSAWGTWVFPATSAEGIGTIIYNLSPTLQVGYKIMEWIIGSGSTNWSGVLAEFHANF